MKKLIGIIILSVVSFATYSQDEEATNRNFVIKFAPTQIVAGELNFSYEQRIARIISLELEVGPTISQFGINFGNQKLWRGNSGGVQLWNFDAIDIDARSAVGFHVSLAPRFYPASDDNLMKGLYLSPVFKFRQYNYVNEDDNGLLDDAKSSINQGVFRFNFGLQFWPKGGKFSIDMYFGIGLGTFNIKGQQVVSEYNSTTMNYDTRWDTYRDNGVRFNAATGIKFGFGM